MNNRSTRGFTLIELLVVIAIVGILAGVVTVNINLRSPAKLVRNEALRLGTQMQMAMDSAIFARQQLGVRFHPGNWEFWILVQNEDGENSTWQLVEDDQLKIRQPGIDLEVEVEIEGVPIVLDTLEAEMAAAEGNEENEIKPHVMFLSNGEVMPDYRVILSDRDGGDHVQQVYMGEEKPIIVESPEE